MWGAPAAPLGHPLSLSNVVSVELKDILLQGLRDKARDLCLTSVGAHVVVSLSLSFQQKRTRMAETHTPPFLLSKC